MSYHGGNTTRSKYVFILIALVVLIIPAFGQKTANEYYREGIFLSNQGKFEDANLSFDRAIELDPEFAEAWYYKSAISRALSNYTVADEAYKKAVYHKYTDHWYYLKGWLTIAILFIAYIIFLLIPIKIGEIELKFWYNLLAIYFFIISFSEVYISGIILDVYDIKRLIPGISIIQPKIWLLSASLIFALICAWVVLFSVYVVPKAIDWSRIFIKLKFGPLCPNNSDLSQIGNTAFFSALIFIILKFAYHWTAVASASQISGTKMDFSVSTLMYLYYSIMFFAIFVNIAIYKIEKDDFRLLKAFFENKSDTLKAQYINSVYFLLNSVFFIILGSNAYAIFSNETNQTIPIVVGYFISILAYLHLIYYRSFYITMNIPSYPSSSPPPPPP